MLVRILVTIAFTWMIRGCLELTLISTHDWMSFVFIFLYSVSGQRVPVDRIVSVWVYYNYFVGLLLKMSDADPVYTSVSRILQLTFFSFWKLFPPSFYLRELSNSNATFVKNLELPFTINVLVHIVCRSFRTTKTAQRFSFILLGCFKFIFSLSWTLVSQRPLR